MLNNPTLLLALQLAPNLQSTIGEQPRCTLDCRQTQQRQSMNLLCSAQVYQGLEFASDTLETTILTWWIFFHFRSGILDVERKTSLLISLVRQFDLCHSLLPDQRILLIVSTRAFENRSARSF